MVSKCAKLAKAAQKACFGLKAYFGLLHPPEGRLPSLPSSRSQCPSEATDPSASATARGRRIAGEAEATQRDDATTRRGGRGKDARRHGRRHSTQYIRFDSISTLSHFDSCTRERNSEQKAKERKEFGMIRLQHKLICLGRFFASPSRSRAGISIGYHGMANLLFFATAAGGKGTRQREIELVCGAEEKDDSIRFDRCHMQ